MPAKGRQQTAQSPTSPTAQPTAKYTNKDGSKFITVPKVFSSTESREPSPDMPQTITKTNEQTPQAPSDATTGTAGVNRKKQKRRMKQAEAARLAAGQPSLVQVTGAQAIQKIAQLQAEEYERATTQYDAASGDPAYYSDEEGDAHSGSYGQGGSPANGYVVPSVHHKTSKKKGKNRGIHHDPQDHLHRSGSDSRPPVGSMSVPPLLKTGMSKEKIWNTSSQEERERIKLFWLSLGEEERRSLVKVEKDAVLKKMKEQQKHSCSCTVCGRKRVAIEEELEVLYDAYYEELEQYANHQQGDGPPMMAASRRFGPMSGLQPPNRIPPAFNGRQPSRGRIVEHLGDEEDEEDEEEEGDEEYSEDDYSDDEPVEEIPRSHAVDFFNFGQSLTVQGGILTVADDLLKNDGKKFIEMMEQLAERRMAREEDAKEQMYSASNGYQHPSNGNMPPHSHHTHNHNHAPPPDEEDYEEDEEDEDEYDSQDEDYDEEEMNTMTEEQRMEEGRRMFQIFAARMFEQRVLTAYKEKVAAERQEKLLQELDEEDMAAVEKKAKKAKDAQKKKEKAQQKKLALAEEKSRRDAEKAAEEAALRAAEEKKAEEARLKAEEKRKKREAQKKAEEEEKAKKEAEKQRRIQEQRERQAEIERKAREAKDRERKEKEEHRQKEKEAREAKDREAREKKEKQEKERKEMEAKAKADKEANDDQKRQEQATQQANSQTSVQPAKRPQQPISIPIPAGLHPSQNHASPHIPVATPVVPKAPTPNRPPTILQRDPNSIPPTPLTGKSQNSSPNPSTPQQASPASIGHPGKAQQQQPFLHHPQAISPIHAALKGPPGAFQSGPFPGMQPMGMNAFQPGMMMGPGFGNRIHPDQIFQHQQPMGNQFRPLVGPNGMQMHIGGNGMPIPQGRGFPPQHGPPGLQQVPNGPLGGIGTGFGSLKDAPTQVHARQQSGSFEKGAFDNIPTTQPIARPGPVGRPPSVVHGQRSTENHTSSHNDIDDLSKQLGSSALLDDSDEPLPAVSGNRRASGAIGLGRQYAPNMPFMEPSSFATPLSSYNNWNAAPGPYGPSSSLPGVSYMNSWPTNPNFGPLGAGPNRASQPRSVAIRLMLCKACRNLEGASPDGFINIDTIRQQVERLHPVPGDAPVTDRELLDLCETEGNPNNGGGFFDVRHEADGRVSVRYEPDMDFTPPAGQIGSPVVGGSGVPRFPPGIVAPGTF